MEHCGRLRYKRRTSRPDSILTKLIGLCDCALDHCLRSKTLQATSSIRPGRKMERARSRVARRGSDPRRGDAVSGVQCERLREGFVRSIKEECLSRVIPFGERHLRRTIAEFVEYYHRERNHQGLENELIEGAAAAARIGRIHRRQRLGGLLNYYGRAA